MKHFVFTLLVLSITFFISCEKESESNKKNIPDFVTDFDGNVYRTVKIGNQVWLQDNLKTTHYQNGDEILNVYSQWWDTITSGAYRKYNETNTSIYGLQYNLYAVNDSRNIAPIGCHVPSNEEWEILINFLGGDSIAGGKMKEVGNLHWKIPNTGATNESGFSGLPGAINCHYQSIGYIGYWWSSSELAISYGIFYNNSTITKRNGHKNEGLSIRCLLD